jgi:phosphoglycerol transferase MdoB-like AlkP superfamily enzyme
MLAHLKYLLKYYLFWFIVFFILRLTFLIYYFKLSFPLIYLWDDIFFHGSRLDLSASGYLVLLPFLVILVSVFLPGKWSSLSVKIYTQIMVAVLSIIAAVDLISYGDWGFRMDATPLFYLSKPRAAAASASFLSIVLHSLIAISLFLLLIIVYKYLFQKDKCLENKPRWFLFPIILIIIGSLFFPIRGSIGTAPINIGSAYFSDIAFINHASINLPWNIGYSLTNLETVSNPYKFMEAETAAKLFTDFTRSQSSDFKVLTNERPNIILIILESFTANATGCLNETIHVTPNLDKLAKEGMLFSQCYSSGNRTDKGMVAILSGYPSQPTTSIIKFPNKTQSLPALPRELRKHGYSTSFYYGGDIEFANYKSFVINAGFDKIFSLKDFPENQKISSWGVPDQYLFDRVYADISSGSHNPYLITLFTLSSHPPFDVPMEPYLEGYDVETKFCNSMYYTDRCLGAFVDSLEKNNLLENTLLVFVADHGSTWPGNLSNTSPAKYHIPLVMYGGALANKDTIINTIVNQTDLAPTLLDQMGINRDEFVFGKNIFAPDVQQKTLYMFNNGFGYISDSLQFYYQRDPNDFTVLNGNMNQKALEEGKAYLQMLYEDLLDR